MRSCSWDTIKTLRASRIQPNMQTNTIKLCVRTSQSNSTMVSCTEEHDWSGRVFSERASSKKIKQNWFKLKAAKKCRVVGNRWVGQEFLCSMRAWRIHIVGMVWLSWDHVYLYSVNWKSSRRSFWNGVITSKVYGAAMDIWGNNAPYGISMCIVRFAKK